MLFESHLRIAGVRLLSHAHYTDMPSPSRSDSDSEARNDQQQQDGLHHIDQSDSAPANDINHHRDAPPQDMRLVTAEHLGMTPDLLQRTYDVLKASIEKRLTTDPQGRIKWKDQLLGPILKVLKDLAHSHANVRSVGCNCPCSLNPTAHQPL